jgi:hypothetical protein
MSESAPLLMKILQAEIELPLYCDSLLSDLVRAEWQYHVLLLHPNII